MSIVYNNTEEKSELQQRIMADLREKQNRQSSDEGKPSQLTKFDDLSNPAYTEGLHQTGSLRWLGAVVAIVALIGLLVLMFKMQG